MRIPTSFNMMGCSQSVPHVVDPLAFTAVDPNSSVKLHLESELVRANYVDVYMSMDGEAWAPYVSGTQIALSNVGDTVYFWNKTNTFSYGERYSLNNYFEMTGSIAASGNVNSLINFSDLRYYCFASLFYGCEALTTAPELPSTALNIACYHEMFNQCPNLSEVTVAFTSWIPNTTNYWLNNVSTTGTFRCPRALGTNETIQRGNSYCPSGWTVVNTD